MRSIPLLTIFLLFAACDAPRGDHAGEDIHAEVRRAVDEGDARRALRILRTAARDGDLTALETLAGAYDRGYLQGGTPGATKNLVITRWPGAASRWNGAFERELEARVEAGDPEGLLARARLLLDSGFEDGEWRSASAEDSTAALHIITELSEAGHLAAMEWLGLLMIRHDRETAAAWLRRAQDAGSSDACWFLFHFIDRGSLVFDAEGLSGVIDRAEECHALSEEPQPGRDFAGRVVASLREQAAVGNEEAIVQLDSLESLGVFERHARLAIADPPRPKADAAWW